MALARLLSCYLQGYGEELLFITRYMGVKERNELFCRQRCLSPAQVKDESAPNGVLDWTICI